MATAWASCRNRIGSSFASRGLQSHLERRIVRQRFYWTSARNAASIDDSCVARSLSGSCTSCSRLNRTSLFHVADAAIAVRRARCGWRFRARLSPAERVSIAVDSMLSQ